MSDKDLLEVKDVSKDVSGKYVCMATNCIDRSIRSNVSNSSFIGSHIWTDVTCVTYCKL